MKRSFNLLLSAIVLCGVLSSCSSDAVKEPAFADTSSLTNITPAPNLPVSSAFEEETIQKAATSTEAAHSLTTTTISSVVAAVSFPATTILSFVTVVSFPTVTTSSLVTASSSLAVTTQPTSAATASAVAERAEYSEMELCILQLVNKAREQHGLAPLKLSDAWYPCAQIRASEADVFFSHTRPDGRNWVTVAYDYGLERNAIKASENLGKKFQTADSIMLALMDSEGHRRNILDPDMNEMAICVLPMTENPEYFVLAQMFLKAKT